MNHSSLHFNKYRDHKAGVQRAVDLQLYTRCLSNKHKTENCPGHRSLLPWPCKTCHTPVHVAPMCPEYVVSNKCLEHSNADICNSVIILIFSQGANICQVLCLIDTGAQISLLDDSVLSSLNISEAPILEIEKLHH